MIEIIARDKLLVYGDQKPNEKRGGTEKPYE